MKLLDEFGNAPIGRIRRIALRLLELAWFKVAGPDGKGWDDGYRQGCADGGGVGELKGREEGRRSGFNFARGMAVRAMQTWAEEFPEQASTRRRNFQLAAEQLSRMLESGWFPKFYEEVKKDEKQVQAR